MTKTKILTYVMSLHLGRSPPPLWPYFSRDERWVHFCCTIALKGSWTTNQFATFGGGGEKGVFEILLTKGMPFTIVSFLVMAGRGGKTSLQRGVSWYFVFHFESDREAQGQESGVLCRVKWSVSKPSGLQDSTQHLFLRWANFFQLLPSVNRHSVSDWNLEWINRWVLVLDEVAN